MKGSSTVKRSTAHGAATTKSASQGAASLGGTAAPGVNFPLLARDMAALNLEAIGWQGVEAKYYELQGLLSAPTGGLNASQARQQQKQYVSAAITTLLDRAQGECRRLLVMGDATGAVDGGLKTLRLKQLYYGDGSLPLVPAYFHLARTNQFLDKFKAAEEFLSLAQWTMLQHPEADVSLKAELHQTFGLLYASDARLDAALKQLTCATYYLSVMNGPEHVITSFGYFDIANVFAAKSNMESAMAFYDKVKDIWHSHLTQALRLQLLGRARESENDVVASGPAGGRHAHSTNEPLLHMGTPVEMGEENVADAAKMLRGILALQKERFTTLHPSTARACYVLGMFLLWVGDRAGALDTMLRTVEACRRLYGDRHPTTVEVRQLITAFGMAIPEDTSGFIDDETVAAHAAATRAAAAAPPAAATAPAATSSPPPPPAAAAAATHAAADPEVEGRRPQKAAPPAASHAAPEPAVVAVPQAAEQGAVEPAPQAPPSAPAEEPAETGAPEGASAAAPAEEGEAPPPEAASPGDEGEAPAAEPSAASPPQA